MPTPNATSAGIQTHGNRFEMALYFALHPHAELRAANVGAYFGITTHAAHNILAQLAEQGLARRIGHGVYGQGDDLARTLRTLREPMAPPAGVAA